MKSTKAFYICRDCGAESLRWEGRCPSCGEWNALIEAPASPRAGRTRAGAFGEERVGPSPLAGAGEPVPARICADFGEVDRVLGGGVVPGSLLMLGGPPGVGKSTLLLQIASRVSAKGFPVLYVSGEESRDQVRLRAQRLGPGVQEVQFFASTDVEEILRAADSVRPSLLCVDSIQSAASGRLPSAAGGIAQVRECAALLQEWSKSAAVATVLVGHVTKGGVLAGPRTLEHLVDVVLYLEGPRSGEHRLLRSSKNRFGSVDEVAAFRMVASGLEPVIDPSALFVSERPESVSGSAIAVPIQGTRPLLTEVQALSAKARFAAPQRICTGFPARRLAILLAVLERRAGQRMGESDVFVSVVGGLRLSDPATDLPLAAALLSADRDRPLPARTAFVGEIGLGGEVRGVERLAARVGVARAAGMQNLVLPAVQRDVPGAAGQAAIWVEHVRELTNLMTEA